MAVLPEEPDDIYTGLDYAVDVIWYDETGNAVNLTGYTAFFSIHANFDHSLLYSQSTIANGRITIPTPTNGTIIVTVPNSETLKVPEGKCRYDLYVVSGTGVKTPLLLGPMTVHKFL